VFGEFSPPWQAERGSLSLSIDMRGGHYQYVRTLAGERVERSISAGLSRLLVNPVEPFNAAPGVASHLELEFPSLTLEPGATETIFLTFPVEVGVFVEGIRETEVIDIIPVQRPKYSLYGSPRKGIITRFARSGRHRDVPPVEGVREGVLKLALRNSFSDWIHISRVVLPEDEIWLYTGGYASMLAMMRITGRDTAEVTGVDRPLTGGMRRALDLSRARKIQRLGAASPKIPGMERKGFLMEAGVS
jgi:uncharacterized protein